MSMTDISKTMKLEGQCFGYFRPKAGTGNQLFSSRFYQPALSIIILIILFFFKLLLPIS